MSNSPTDSGASMNIALEFHDSEVRSIEAIDGSLRIAFSSAYVHHSTGEAGVDAGSGFIQALEMVLSEAVWSGPLHECVGKLSDGQIAIDGHRMLSLLPLPYEHTGNVAIELVFANGATLATSAQSVRVRFLGEPRFVESFGC